VGRTAELQQRLAALLPPGESNTALLVSICRRVTGQCSASVSQPDVNTRTTAFRSLAHGTVAADQRQRGGSLCGWRQCARALCSA
jgi:hypothetical protein